MPRTDNSGEKMFTLRLSASQLYSLQTIVSHAAVSIDDPGLSYEAGGLECEVNRAMASEEFVKALDEEAKEFEEQQRKQQEEETPYINGSYQ